MKNPISGPPETKVAVSAFTGGLVALIAQILHEYVPGFHPPSATLVALVVTTVAAIAGYLAPHTHVPVNPTVNEIAKAAHTLGMEVHPVVVPVQPPPVPAVPAVPSPTGATTS